MSCGVFFCWGAGKKIPQQLFFFPKKEQQSYNPKKLSERVVWRGAVAPNPSFWPRVGGFAANTRPKKQPILREELP